MERLKTLMRRLFPGRREIRRRWLLECLLPCIFVVLLTLGGASIYALLTLRDQALPIVVVIAATGGILMILLWLLCDRFIRQVSGQLGQLRSQAQRITEGSYGIRTEKRYDDELGDLTQSINEMSVEIARSKRQQSEFVSSVSHELRTPLTAITGWAEAMGYDPAIRGDSRRGVDIISKEASRLTKMVGELLEFTRIQDGRFNLNIETVDIAAETEDALFSFNKLLQEEGIELAYSCNEEGIPMIEADPERVKQVLLNILDNAAKYGRYGRTIEVAVTAEETEDGDGDRDADGEDFVTITVRDHGPGIPEDELPHVKERFFKGSSKERGSGIGLAVCEEIVTRHGGRLLIENCDDGGVLVTVRLPVIQS